MNYLFLALFTIGLSTLALYVSYQSGKASVQWQLDLALEDRKELRKQLADASSDTAKWPYPKYTIDMFEFSTELNNQGLYVNGDGFHFSRLHKSVEDAKKHIAEEKSAYPIIYKIELKEVK